MKRHGLILFLVALLILPIMALNFTSCAKKAVTTEAPGISAEEKARQEAERKKREQAEREKAAAEAKKKAEAEAKLKEQQLAREKAAAYAQRALFLNQHVHFDFDKYTIKTNAEIVLRAKADYMKKNPKIAIEIQGHCDERGTLDYNLALGDRRANAAAKYLMSLGISQSRIETISYGEERPLNPGHNEDAWAENRRAQFLIISGE
ncbi:MAG: peptidoglycan-associated lipoprotein Pal [Deltaproteobacteria bacterium]|nr:peptidoglycan-associated lipoprotein Pal [Deltaproteobacteria bacterium]MBW2053075.1 peptidoglycan-associated lipoprotein Pal [Deltaproteobacteria bacterium]MBW2141623.1 peptidoglycan-associated lipoprotein Pal [Deltaproteobacteria bacterium]MBW2321901.1 peptidoglycan-associated lipoprotein Pal [Deltaproteobacteria bacterium]